MSNFFNKRPWLLKRVIFVIVSSILLTALEQVYLAACKLHGALVFQSGSKHEYRGEFHRKKIGQVTQPSWLLTISAGPLVKV